MNSGLMEAPVGYAEEHLVGKRPKRKSYWEEWKRVEERDGWLFYTWPSGERQMTRSDSKAKGSDKSRRLVKEWFEQLHPVERELHPVLPVLGIVEPRLKQPFWRKLRDSAPRLYAHLILVLYALPGRQEMIEDVEGELSVRSLGWGKLRSVEGRDASLLDSASRGLHLADAMDMARKEWRRKHEKCVEFITSNESLFSIKFRAQSKREIKESLRWIREQEESTSIALRQRAKEAYETVAKDHPELLRQKVTPKLRVTSVLNAIILSIVAEVRSAGFSATKSYELTNEILKILYPSIWPEGSVPDNVRQRYDYWSTKARTKR